jgi:hypothetical protein
MTSTLEAIRVSNSALPAIRIIGFSSSSLLDRRTVAECRRAPADVRKRAHFLAASVSAKADRARLLNR